MMSHAGPDRTIGHRPPTPDKEVRTVAYQNA